MALETDFLDFATETLTLEPLSTVGPTDYGAPQFSTTAQSYSAYVEPDEHLIRNNDGQEVLTKFFVAVMSSSAAIGTHDRVTVTGLSTDLSIAQVNPRNDDEGLHHTELLLT